MKLSRSLLYIPLLTSLSFARPQDSPNDDSDDDLPSCAAGCSNALSSSALAAGSNNDNLWVNACQNSGILNAFESCYKGTQCSDDDMDGAHDWIRSTCAVVRRTASATHTTSPATTTGSASATTTGSTGSSTTATATSSSSTTSSTATATSTPDSGLSTGAKAGIGIGVALAALLLLAAVLAFCIHRMRKSRRDSQALWPDNVNGWEQLRSENAALTGGAAAAAAAGAGAGAVAGAAMAERGGRYDPRDPYSAWTPLPNQPELGGTVLGATDRHELQGGGGYAASRGSPFPTSLAIGGGRRGSGGDPAAANGGVRYVSELDGTGVARNSSSPSAAAAAALVRKPVNQPRFSQQSLSDSSGRGLLSGSARSTPERPVSSVSDASEDEDEDERERGRSHADPARVPLPMSPVSPTSPTRRV